MIVPSRWRVKVMNYHLAKQEVELVWRKRLGQTGVKITIHQAFSRDHFESFLESSVFKTTISMCLVCSRNIGLVAKWNATWLSQNNKTGCGYWICKSSNREKSHIISRVELARPILGLNRRPGDSMLFLLFLRNKIIPNENTKSTNRSFCIKTSSPIQICKAF